MQGQCPFLFGLHRTHSRFVITLRFQLLGLSRKIDRGERVSAETFIRPSGKNSLEMACALLRLDIELPGMGKLPRASSPFSNHHERRPEHRMRKGTGGAKRRNKLE